MKKIIFTTFGFAITLASIPDICIAQIPKSGARIFGGFTSLTLQGQEFTHDTHPDDHFLPNANAPGSAGKTELGRINFLSLGFGYRQFLSRVTSLTFDADFLIGIGTRRDVHQNDNDSRHPYNAAFVYSEVNWGLYADISFQYYIKRFYFGLETQLGGAFVESGWDRFDSDQSVSNDLEFSPSIGPQIGFWFLEGTIQFGNGVGYSIQGVYYF